jgi:hypothetical protein
LPYFIGGGDLVTDIAKRHRDTILNSINESVFGYGLNELNRNAFHQWMKPEKRTSQIAIMHFLTVSPPPF